MTRRTVLPIGPRSLVLLLTVSAVGVFAFCWPLVLPITQTTTRTISHTKDAPWLFVLILPLLAGVVLAQVAEGGMDAKVVALLGMLTAVIAGLRAISPGAAGMEPGFFVLLLAGYAFGPGFGFVLGALGMLAGGLITGGAGPWLPFQMFANAWVGALGGLTPGRRRDEPSRSQIWCLALLALVAGLAYGIVMNLWFWPFVAFESAVTFIPGDDPAANAVRYARFWLVTSLGWDLPRGIVSALLVLAFGRLLLRAFARVSRKAAFGAAAEFGPPRS